MSRPMTSVEPGAKLLTPAAGPAKTYKRIEKVVQAVAMTGSDFLLEDEKRHINGKRENDFRPGFKVIDGPAVTWIPREDFERDFVQLSGAKD